MKWNHCPDSRGIGVRNALEYAEHQINRVLIDERKGRKIAREVYNLQVIGFAEILVEAKRRGYLDNVKEALTAMRRHGYWLHDRIVTAILKEAGER